MTDAKLSVNVPDGFVHERSISELEIGVTVSPVGAEGTVCAEPPLAVPVAGCAAIEARTTNDEATMIATTITAPRIPKAKRAMAHIHGFLYVKCMEWGGKMAGNGFAPLDPSPSPEIPFLWRGTSGSR